MPHAGLKLIPGVDRNRTEALNEAAIFDCNLIRFVPDRQGQGLPQKLGGWDRFLNTSSWNSIVRALHAWADTNGQNFFAIGSETSLWASNYPNDATPISPQYYTANIAVNVSTTVNSSIVIITDTGSNVTSYDAIYIETPISIGGLVLSGFYECSASGANSYTIVARNVIGGTTPATATATGGAVPSFTSIASNQTITVTLANHGYSVGSTFTVLVPTTVGGVELSGNYLVGSIVSPSQFTISAANSPTSSATVSENGGNARIIYYIGKKSSPPASGYGAGGYGVGGYGSGVTFSGAGRTYTGTTVVTTLGVTTVTIPSTIVNVRAGSVVSDGTNTFTVTSSTSGPVNSTFTFSGTPTGTTFTVTLWGFQMPDQASADWALDNWGEYLIASPHMGEIFYWNPADSSSSVIIPNAPLVNEGCFVAMPERQIIAYGSTFTGVQDPMLVRWCDVSNFTSWVGTVTNQAGSYRIPKGSKIIGGLQGPQQGLLWTDLGLWSMQYINLPLVWSFNEIASGCGLIGKKAAGTIGGTVYWMSQSQFFRLSGGGVEPVECPVWDIVFQGMDPNQANWDNIRCAPNSRFGEIAWYYPPAGGNGEPTRYVKYNTLLNQWDFGELTRTAWIDQSVFGPPIGAGGINVYQHETSNNAADGETMNSFFQTGYFAISDGDVKTFVDQVWPDMKWGQYSQSNNANVDITFSVADYPGNTPTEHPYTVTQATQFITPRFRSRLVSIKVGKDDNSDTFWRVGNIRYRFQPDGKF